MRPGTWNASGDSTRARTVPDAPKPTAAASATAAVRTHGGSAAAVDGGRGSQPAARKASETTTADQRMQARRLPITERYCTVIDVTAPHTAPARPGRPIDRRKDDAIVEAARALLFSRGPQGVTMEAVARAARVAKPTLYSRYGSRRDLLLAVVAVEARRVFRALDREPRDAAALEADLRDFVADLLAFLCSAQHRRLTQALGMAPQRPADLREIFRAGPQRTLEVLAAYLGRAHDRRLLRSPTPADSAELLLGMAMGLDFVRSEYGVPPARRVAAARRAHVARVVGAFLALHAASTGCASAVARSPGRRRTRRLRV